MRLLLDDFGRCCQEMIALRRDGAEVTRLPKLPPYPDDSEGWTWLQSALGMQCLRFPSRVRASEDLIRWVIVEQEEDFDNTINEEVARLGLEAHRLARKLCNDYGLNSDEGEYVPWLKAELEDVAKNREWRRTASRPPEQPAAR
jgi:hypothetical protein